MLPGCVEGVARERRQTTRDRAHVDDDAAALRAHGRKHQAGHADRTPEVGLHCGSGLILREILDRAGQSDTGVVDEYVDASVPSQHVADRGSGGCITGDIERDDLDLDAGIGGRLLQTVRLSGVAHRRDHRVAIAGERDRGAQPDTGRAAGDKYD